MVIKEDDLGDLRVSLRSKGVADVSAVATALGGGGHRYAAGFTSDTRDIDELVAAVRVALDASVDAADTVAPAGSLHARG
jgi:phosphoesterase RecJ-like protein